MSRKNNYWGASQYRGSRRSGRGAVLAVFVVLVVLAVAAAAVWFFLPTAESDPADPPPPAAQSEPVQAVVEPSEAVEPAPTLPPAPEAVRGIYISGPMAGSAYVDELIAPDRGL